MTADLVAFLRERLDEDERDPGGWSPARVLAEVDAKRRILDGFEPALAQEELDPADMENQAVLGTLERVAALLALPYAEHPDYRPEWAPDQKG